jgi:hypothetical protein
VLRFRQCIQFGKAKENERKSEIAVNHSEVKQKPGRFIPQFAGFRQTLAFSILSISTFCVRKERLELISGR